MNIRSSVSLVAFTAILLGVASSSAYGVRPEEASGSAYSDAGAASLSPETVMRGAWLPANSSVSKAPLVIAEAVPSASAIAVTLKEIVLPNDSPTRYWIAFGTSEKSLRRVSDKSGPLTGTTAVTTTVKGLRPKTTYYFQFYASNAGGTTAGAILSAKTGELGSRAADLLSGKAGSYNLAAMGIGMSNSASSTARNSRANGIQ
jgi:hypothetical protein